MTDLIDKRYDEFVTALPMPAMVIGATDQVVATNTQLDGLLGQGLAGRHYINALRQPALLEAIEKTRATRTPGKVRYLGRDGTRDTTYQVHVAALDDRIVLTFEDRTTAEAVDQLRRDFVANVSHELRTPLTSFIGFIETLQGPARDDPAAQERFLGFMAREARRMTGLVDDLLSLSRVEETARVKPDTPVALGALVAATVADLEPMIKGTGKSVSIADQSAGATVPGDAAQLRQVVVNLIANALKYGSDDGPVTLTVGPQGESRPLRRDGVTLSVHNPGPGIASHHIPRLTERFYRVDDHRSRDVGGTGLGLAIVKHIVNRHRGRLAIDSAAGQGVTVRVILPVD